MLQTMEISLTPFDAARIVLDHVQSSGMTVECVGQHATATESGHQMALLIFEKYYMRTSSRASLTVVIENLAGPTKAVFRGSGGGEGVLFRFDWGASADFASGVIDALEPYATPA